MSAPGVGWHLVVPVRGGPLSKSRLQVPRATRVSLAEAFARDTVAALAAGAPGGVVLVVTGDAAVRRWVQDAGQHCVEDPGEGLDSAVVAGAAAARTGRVAVMLADHPALRPEEVRIALAAAELLGPTVIADADHDGTALLTLPGGPGARTAFGPGSAAAHERLGHQRLHLDLPGLLRDVDDAASLATAVRLGVGPHTAQALTRATLPGMQATIHSMAEDGSGSALLDDGVEVALPAESAVSAGLRHLRVGQRVSIELDEEGQRAVRVWIVGIGPGESIA
ncbi:MAG: 2-phospho-L-lactate guanylyltransferase [Ornithinibacter sp.]